jgi:hypothetical protein
MSTAVGSVLCLSQDLGREDGVMVRSKTIGESEGSSVRPLLGGRLGLLEGSSVGVIGGYSLFRLGVSEGKAEGAMLLSTEGIELGCCGWVPLRNSSSSSTLGALVETELALASDNDGSSVAGLVEMWSEGLDDGKPDGANDRS